MDKFDLSTEEIGRIVNFLGYGRLSAPVWFIGIEEGLGSVAPRDEDNNLKARGNLKSEVMDLHEAHLLLQECGESIDIEKKQKFTQVWLWMAKFMLADKKSKDFRSRDNVAAKNYARFDLGRCGRDTFMTELSPIPARSIKHKNWIKWFEDRDPNLHTHFSQRRDKLKQYLKLYALSLVICYGNRKERADDLEAPPCHQMAATAGLP